MAGLTRRGFIKSALGAAGVYVASALSGASRLFAQDAPGGRNAKRVPMTPQQTPQFYDSRDRLISYYRAHARSMGLAAKTPAELEAWSAAARAKFIELIGFDRLTPAKPNPRMTGKVDCGEFVREHWLIDTEPGVTMPMFILRPKGASGPAPAVICCHGHGSGKDSVAEGNGFGVQFARAGMLAVCPDARGFGERREVDARGKVGGSSCTFLQMTGLPLGISVIGTHAFDLVRLIDHLRSRDDVRGDRIGCAGFSGGGWQSLATGAIDDRLACVVVSAYLHPVAAPLLYRKHNCACNMVPHLWELFDLGDIAALVAPTPLLIQTGKADSLSGPDGVANVQPQVDIARQAYQLLGCADRIGFDIHDGGHQWNGAKAVPWVRNWLAG